MLHSCAALSVLFQQWDEWSRNLETLYAHISRYIIWVLVIYVQIEHNFSSDYDRSVY